MCTNENLDIKKRISDFKDNKVWMTKKSRIESEARMKANDTFSQIIISYYTFWVLSISIYGLIDNTNNTIGLLTTIISVGLFGLSIFIGVIDYKGKAYRYKESYTQLGELENALESLLESNDTEDKLVDKLNESRKEYNSILKLTENHEEIDYINVRVRNNYDWTLQKKILKHKIINFTLKSVIILFPIISTIIYFFKGRS